MALSQRLELRQTQALVMTPQLMQAIKLLQLSSLDLAAYVENELERNPLLERANDDDAPAAATEGESNNQPAEGSEDGAANPDWMGADLETSRSSMEQGLGTELENVFPDDGGEKLAKPETPEPAYSEWSGAGAASRPSFMTSIRRSIFRIRCTSRSSIACWRPVRRMHSQHRRSAASTCTRCDGFPMTSSK